jgi:hypothetical protein
MYPYIAQNLAAEHARNLREQAAAARRGGQARRARRAPGLVAATQRRAPRPGAPRWA